ncbi:MAG: hypothetical protein K6G51_04785 [Sphaerochaetaceae bacterium]|nr:hypothetical protein [Sphaerochaetaceae bacterium]
MNEDAIEFIKQLEEKLGAKITYKAFCTFYADSNGNIRESGVFLCRYGDSIYYEDFEPQHNDLLELVFSKQKKKKEFVKTSWNFKLADIESITLVSQGAARKDPKHSHKKANPFSKLLERQVFQIKLKDNTLLFFEAIDKKDFLKNLT